MGRALIVGSDLNFCLKLKSFLESENFIVTMTSNRKEGIERLFYEKPALTFLEFFTSKANPKLIGRINSSGVFEIVDIELEKKPRRVPGFSSTKPVFILKDPDRVGELISSVKFYLGLISLHGLYEEEAEEIKLEKEKMDSRVKVEDVEYEEEAQEIKLEKADSRVEVEIEEVKRVEEVKKVEEVEEVGEGEEILELEDVVSEEGKSYEEDFDETGNLADVPYPVLLISFYREKKTGILTIDSQVKFKVYFVEGLPVFAEEGALETALGKVLLSCGMISEADYEKALGINLESSRRIGEILIEMGVISPHELSNALELQVREKLMMGFECRNGTYGFKNTSDFLGNIVTYRVQLAHLIYEGIKQFENSKEIEERLSLEKNLRVIPSPELKEVVKTLNLPPKEFRVIQILKDSLEVNEVFSKSPLSRDDTIKFLYFLTLFGFVEVESFKAKFRVEEKEQPKEPQAKVEEQTGEEKEVKKERVVLEGREEVTYKKPTLPKLELKLEEEIKAQKGENLEMEEEKETNISDEILSIYSTLDEKNYYEILGVPKNARKEEIKQAYIRLAKKFHPDAHPGLSKELREKAEEVFARITLTYQILYEEESRGQYNLQLEVEHSSEDIRASYEAELAFKKGEILFKQGRHIEAKNYFARAVELSPKEAAYRAALAWAHFMGARDKDRVIDEVKKMLDATIELSPEFAQAYYYLGCIYKYADDEERAERFFQKALKSNPNHIEAQREIRLIHMRKEKKEEKKKGSWPNSLFKR